jgi:hypothetical protein
MAARKTARVSGFKPRFQYAVKFLCTSNILGTSQTTASVLPGSYRTAINVHNPNPATARVRQKIVLGPDTISKYVSARIKPDALLRVDCDRIARGFGITSIHGMEGFVIVESSINVDVTAVYTAGAVGGHVVSIDVEQIHERTLEPAE